MKEYRNALIMNDRKHVPTQVRAPEKTPALALPRKGVKNFQKYV